MSFVTGPVAVSVPATSANLGPGFDALGLALDLRDTLVAEVRPQGLHVDAEGAGADEVPRDERHLVVRSMRVAFDHLGVRPPGLWLSCTNAVPHARGLGSSSAAIVGGLTLARALVDGGEERLPHQGLFELAARMEGHPDNVAPACLGGFVVAGHDDDGFFAVRSDVDPRISAVVFVPADGVETSVARSLLPATVPHADAATNAGRAALLVAALSGRPEQLLRGTHDLLHQQYRRPAMPDSLDLVAALRADGVPAILSGAGPTVLAFVADLGGAGAAGTTPDVLMARCPDGWRAHHLGVCADGVRLL